MTQASEQSRGPDSDRAGAEPHPTAEAGPAGPPADLPTTAPEPAFAARRPPPGPPPPPPPPAPRRVVFLDIENTARPEHMARVIEYLVPGRIGPEIQLVAVGNWRVIGQEMGRLLAARGAQLVHSAPSVGVRDWTDLRIAVSAGVWLATARAGDVLEVVSDDRAFDAVGDVAAALGIGFRRLSYRTLVTAPTEPAAPATPPEPPSRRRGRRSPQREAAPAASAPATAPVTGHTAPHDELVDVVRGLAGAPGQSVLLDTLARELKARGYSRTPGSPRLITRLRRIKEVSVSRNGLVTLVAPGPAPTPEAAPVAPGRRRRSSRRGRRRRPRRPASGSDG